MTEVPLVLVTGLAGPQAQTVADKLASRDTAVVHHDLGGVSEGVVAQRRAAVGRNPAERGALPRIRR